MPASSCTLPRQMFPPPTTMAIETPARRTSAISSAIARVVLTSTPDASPVKASPDIFRSTRAYRDSPSSLPKRVSCKAPHADLLAERPDGTNDQIADAHRVVLDECLVEQAMLLVPLRELAFDDLFGDLRRLAGRNARAKLVS